MIAIPGSGTITAGLALALALSLGANAWIAHAYVGAREDVATAESNEKQASSAAKLCSDGVLSLKAAAETREQAALASRDAALGVARQNAKTASELLSRQSQPGKECAAAQAAADEWFSGRVPK